MAGMATDVVSEVPTAVVVAVVMMEVNAVVVAVVVVVEGEAAPKRPFWRHDLRGGREQREAAVRGHDVFVVSVGVRERAAVGSNRLATLRKAQRTC